MLSLGIVGLPNVGKSSLFNALTSAKAEAANYPFCTVDPNIGMVEVPDPRLSKLAEIVKPERTVPAVIQFVDIAGLVKGASQGEGLGNKFLTNIRETDAIVHVVRCFEDPDVTHVMGSVDPVRDREVIEFELALSDLGAVEKRLDKSKRAARTGEKEAQAELPTLEKAHAALAEGKALWHVALTPTERALLAPLQLLTLKPVLYAANVTDGELQGEEGAHVKALRAAIEHDHEPAEVVTFSAKIEENSPTSLRKNASSFLRRSAWSRPASIGSSAPATTSSACRPTSPPARRKFVPGRFIAVTPRPKPRP